MIVIYSSFTKFKYKEFPNSIIDQNTVLIFSGITVSIGKELFKICKFLCKIAEERNAIVCFDVNYRSKLWGPKKASYHLANIMHKSNIIISTQQDLQLLFNNKNVGVDLAYWLKDNFNCEIGIVTNGSNGAYAVDENGDYYQPIIKTSTIERLGSGDSFFAGFLHGLSKGTAHALKCGTWLAALKRTFFGDIAWINAKILNSYIENEFSYWR